MDLRKKVLGYVQKTGSQTKACEVFGLSRKTVYNWMHRRTLEPTPAKTRKRKLDKVALAKHVRDYPDALLRERALVFAVDVSAIWRALDKLKICLKKNDVLRPKKARATDRVSPRAKKTHCRVRKPKHCLHR